MAKPELGTKRLCGACGAKFYDLNKEKIVCLKCATVFEVIVPVSRTRPDAAAARPVAPAAKVAEVEAVEAEGAEFVSLEDADAEAQGKTKTGAAGEAVDAEEEIEGGDEAMDDAVFIEEQEDGDPDVTDIIGDGIEKEEET